jgi:endogenous inhibitor of DNA gyrase (YacG/DUF329 family)
MRIQMMAAHENDDPWTRTVTDSTYSCPTCGQPVRDDAPDFPFCSERCRWVDLGEWLNESYRVSRPLTPGPDTDPLEGGEAAEDVSSGESDDD